MSKNKPTAVPPHEPPKNPEWPSKTGNPSGKDRGNAKSKNKATTGNNNPNQKNRRKKDN